jgi:hypothetical protein
MAEDQQLPPPRLYELNKLLPDCDDAELMQLSSSITQCSISDSDIIRLVNNIANLIELIKQAFDSPSENLLVRRPRAIDIWMRLFRSINFSEYGGTLSSFLRKVFSLFQDIKSKDPEITQKMIRILAIHSSICSREHFLQEFQALIVNCMVLDLQIVDERRRIILELIENNILPRGF